MSNFTQAHWEIIMFAKQPNQRPGGVHYSQGEFKEAVFAHKDAVSKVSRELFPYAKDGTEIDHERVRAEVRRRYPKIVEEYVKFREAEFSYYIPHDQYVASQEISALFTNEERAQAIIKNNSYPKASFRTVWYLNAAENKYIYGVESLSPWPFMGDPGGSYVGGQAEVTHVGGIPTSTSSNDPHSINYSKGQPPDRSTFEKITDFLGNEGGKVLPKIFGKVIGSVTELPEMSFTYDSGTVLTAQEQQQRQMASLNAMQKAKYLVELGAVNPMTGHLRAPSEILTRRNEGFVASSPFGLLNSLKDDKELLNKWIVGAMGAGLAYWMFLS